MHKLVSVLKSKYPKLAFTPSDSFYWSPETNEIFYDKNAQGKIAKWSLIHEAGHALLCHKNYDADYMLLRLEIDAWEKAKEISSELGIEMDRNHIEDCLDTYRDWLHKRSICPKCTNKSIQQSDFTHYECFNCHTRWRVTTSRFCRTYRMKDNTTVAQPVFI